jgi:S-adenosylmethionine:tRNA ribosyltransferase-isomerase
MQLSDFNYDLPNDLIARYPLPIRSASRLLCLGGNGSMEHQHFTKLPDLLNEKDLLIFNNTRVLPARLFATKVTGGRVEIFIERVLSDKQALAMIRASKAPKPGSKLKLLNGGGVEVLSREGEFYLLQFVGQQTLFEILEKLGDTPLPHYLGRSPDEQDKERYQTVYAKEKGAVAAPTAGLHFDLPLLERLSKQGVEFAYLTLHVAAGTFQPVRVADIRQHRMHKEYIHVSEQVCQQVQAAKARGGRIIAVGTTSVRSLETAAQSGHIQPYQGDTDIFIYPGFKFNCVDAIITNFHLPESTLLMLICAFAGYETVMNAYNTAIAEHYRFYSYGDAMVLFK